MNSFELEVECTAGGSKHQHLLIISGGKGEVAYASNTGKVRLRYECPVSNMARYATFKEPSGISRPFAIVSVS